MHSANICQAVIRHFLAIVFVIYSAAKFFGTQFITEGPLLDMPLSQLSGFELTWSYFGSSKLYSGFITLSQLAGGILLLNPRTVRLALLVLLPMIGNIVLVNFAFEISYGTKVFSVILLGLLLVLVAWDWQAWRRFVFPVVSPENRSVRRSLVYQFAAASVLVALVFGTIGTLKKRIMPDCPIAGNWNVVEVVDEHSDEPSLDFQKIYFMDGGSMAIGRDQFFWFGEHQMTPEGQLEFEVSLWPASDELKWRDLLAPELNPDGLSGQERQRLERRTLHFSGNYRNTSDDLVSLEGTLDGSPLKIEMKRD